ncbi:MAG TPA: molybdopterin-dependent oxidoreductase, partial [Terriglobales bacterium]|nr:molybdopterin-dependent oxidoreductase [Terriglobales bacterium]
MPETLKTTCPLDCPDTCALGVTVEDGKITSIGAADGHPVTGGFICSKVRRFGERVYSGERLLYPMRRTGPKGSGTFERITWDAAIAEIAARFVDVKHVWGGEAILPYHYGGSNGWMTDGTLDDLLFARLGASRLARTLCAAHATEVALGMYGKMPGVAFEDFVDARFIVIWGANPKASNIHLVPFLREAKRRGAFIATVDPTQNFSEAEADLHLPVYPGADLPLALGMIRHWEERNCFDREFLAKHARGLETLLEAAREWPLERAAAAARVPADDIRTLADKWAETSPALLRLGWGVERNRNAGQAMAAVMAMPALLGKFGVRGGGYTLSNGGAGKLDNVRLLGDVKWQTRELNMTQLGELLNGKLDPPVKALFIYNCNPAATVPDQNAVLRGLSR